MLPFARIRGIAIVFAGFLSLPGNAQRRGAAPSRPTPAPPTTRSQPLQSDINRLYMVQGTVRMADGTRLPGPAVIERVCSGSVVREGYTDAAGRFNFQIGHNMGMTQDAATDSAMVQKQPAAGTGAMRPQELAGCAIRAALAGYSSAQVELGDKLHELTVDVGTLFLRPREKTEGLTVSATSLSAPKPARKAVESGRKKVEKQSYEEAIADFHKAVDLDPGYAEAWFLLGDAQARLDDLDSAANSYRKAVAADERFVPPYMGLARIAAARMDWNDLAERSEKILALDPYSDALAYFYSGVAHYNLGRAEIAEPRALRAERLDPQHRIPKIYLLLAELMAGKKDYAGAAEHLRTFLRLVPNGKDADAARERLTQLQNEAAQANPQPQL